jgi:hypothetical protein
VVTPISKFVVSVLGTKTRVVAAPLNVTALSVVLVAPAPDNSEKLA